MKNLTSAECREYNAILEQSPDARSDKADERFEMLGAKIEGVDAPNVTDYGVFLMAWAELIDPVKRETAILNQKISAMFRDRDHARAVWDEWDGVSVGGEEAHHYLNLIGDGRYCVV